MQRKFLVQFVSGLAKISQDWPDYYDFVLNTLPTSMAPWRRYYIRIILAYTILFREI